jgi:hypothetical protein
MLAYYDERAPEYEEAYTRGTGTASIPESEVFKAEARELARVVGRIVHGRVMDGVWHGVLVAQLRGEVLPHHVV